MAEDDDDVDIYLKDDKDEDEALQEAMEAGKEGRFMAHVPIPTQRDIEEALLRRKKQELLELLAIDDTLEEIEKVSVQILKIRRKCVLSDNEGS